MTYLKQLICRSFSLLLAFLLFFQASQAQYDFNKVDEWINHNLQDLGGRAVMLLYKDGKVVYSRAANQLSGRQKAIGKIMARRQGKSPEEVMKDFSPDTKINIASCSKWLSAALVMTFVDEGKLQLSDTVGKFLPVMSQHGKGNISILHCLSHLTGIEPGGLKEDIKEITGAASMDQVVEMIAMRPMEAPAGTAFHYSSVGLQLAAAVMEKISGKDFETLFKERIAIPCNMQQTDFGHKPVPLAAGGARGTAADYLNFVQMILQEGLYNGKRVIAAKSIILMQQNQVAGAKVMGSPAEAGDWGYGLGEWVMADRTSNKRSDAVTSPGMFGSFPWVDNKLGYAAVLFTMNLKNKGRNEKYRELKRLTDQAIGR